MTAYCLVSTLLFLFIFSVWSKEGWLNLIIKLLFGAVMMWGLACTLMQFGFHR